MMSPMNSSLLTTLLQQNEIQRALLNEMTALNGNHFTSAVIAGGTQPHYNSQPISNMNGGNTGNKCCSSKEISSYLVYNVDLYFVFIYYIINR